MPDSEHDMQRFTDKIALVTGGAHGIGEATARRLAAEGASVAVLDITDPTPVVESLRADGHRAIALQVDITRIDDVNAAFGRTVTELGAVDVLVNNAGFLRHATALDVTWEEWRRTFAVNVDGILATVKAALPSMIERGGGAIVNTASVGGIFGTPGLHAYTASKGAVVNLTRNLSTDYRRQGVRVNCVCPGWVPTGFNDPMLVGVTDDELQAIVESGVPAGRQADPSEIAAAIVFLASEDASYISGQALVVDGGLTAGL